MKATITALILLFSLMSFSMVCEELFMSKNQLIKKLSTSEFEGSNYIDLHWADLTSPIGHIRIITSHNPLEATIFISKDGTIHL